MYHKFRYRYDSQDSNRDYGDIGYSVYYHKKLLTESIRITEEIFPDLNKLVRNLLDEIRLDSEIEFFITSENSIANAYCVPISKKKAFVVINSRLIELLSKQELIFVIGHEIGHHYYEHISEPVPEDVDEDLKYYLLDKQRSMELSCDRFGLLCTRDFDIAAKAIIKMVSGLGEEHISNNFKTYLNQIKELKNINIKLNDEKYKSHNSWLFRLQALRIFSTSVEYNEHINEPNGKLSCMDIDKLIYDGMLKITGVDPDFVFIKISKKNIYWILADILHENLSLSPESLEILGSCTETTVINKLVNYMQNTSIDNFDKKIKNCHKEIKGCPSDIRLKLFDQINHLLVNFSQKNPKIKDKLIIYKNLLNI